MESRAAMIIDGPWNWAEYQAARLQIGQTLLPKNSDSDLRMSPMVNFKGYSISKQSKNKDAAFKLEDKKGGPKVPKARLVADATTQAVNIGLRNPQRREYSEKEKVGNTYVITNNMEYAEAIAFGTGLPPSWGGSHKSKQCQPGYPEAIAKSMEKWVEREFDRMIRSGRF